MTKTIGFAGKGGVGKTSIAALFLKYLLENRPRSRLLVIDSDPNECMPQAIGAKSYRRLSDVIARHKGSSVNLEQFNQEFATLLLESEQSGYDFLVMGRGEGEGCYCLINNFLKNVYERNIKLAREPYDYILMDCEAGLEHIARRTSIGVEDLVIVTDSSKMGIATISNIKSVSIEVHSGVKNFYVIANKTSEETAWRIKEKAEKLGMHYLGSIPYDPLLEQFNADGKSLLELSQDSIAYKKIVEIAKQII
jgi:CO dehydrogenase maturation factor